ncbi:MAG: hypothetical protein AMXMBFR82_49590 [Candidatus Hydrogenedentota bacterium]
MKSSSCKVVTGRINYRRATFAVPLLFCAVFSASGAADPVFETDVLPIVSRYCVDCHNADITRGDLNIERFETTDMALDSIAVWQRIGKRVENGEMPPNRSDQPSQEERDLFLKWIASLKIDSADCDRLANEESMSWFPGYVMSRRLNRMEYQNTLRDLLLIAIDVADQFPADGAGGEGFDNNGSSLFLSAIQIEKYLEVADRAIEAALPPGTTDSPLIAATPGIGRAPRNAAETALTEFLARAWRRPADQEEVTRLADMFSDAYRRGDSYLESIKLAYKAALVSPHFLFLAEPEPPEPGTYALSGYPLAARLSYFLWGSMPDAELTALAGEGRLQDDEVLRAQVSRMLADPKARALGEMFATQWLGITQLGETTRPDAERFPEFDDALADIMRAEAALVFNRVFREDRSLIELIDADYTYANDRLAAIYGLGGIEGPDMRVVDLTDASRGGVLGMAAVLTATSHPLRTSPVLRGKWVLEQLLGDNVPPPPPNAGTLPEDDHQADGLTLRERMEAHRENPDCASCHARMDPIGFGLESFDPIGRWRTEQAGHPIDATGELPSGESFDGPVELKQILLARKGEFLRNLSRKMLGYGLGRSLTRYDQCVVDDCIKSLQQNDYRSSALVTEIVLSFPFRHRYSGATSEDHAA